MSYRHLFGHEQEAYDAITNAVSASLTQLADTAYKEGQRSVIAFILRKAALTLEGESDD